MSIRDEILNHIRMGGTFTTQEIRKAIDRPYGSVSRELSNMLADGLVERTRVGRETFYTVAATVEDTVVDFRVPEFT